MNLKEILNEQINSKTAPTTRQKELNKQIHNILTNILDDMKISFTRIYNGGYYNFIQVYIDDKKILNKKVQEELSSRVGVPFQFMEKEERDKMVNCRISFYHPDYETPYLDK